MEADFRRILAENAAVVALVPAERIAYQESPQGAPSPRIVYEVVAEQVSEELDGESGWATARVKVDVWAADDRAALEVAEAVKDSLAGFSGTKGATRFYGIFRAARRDHVSRPVKGNAAGERRLTLEWTVNYLG